ncbi:anti-sigma factor [Aquimarina algicola]|uniref:Anti-sigma factor n=1 Tax=Aquimarina algicola TaxID=2589995 RepID=A0A504J435_9FLAO|nr:anti-sigma factor [Aquimarina algicola]TPN85214.1 anti-sigma factor [Aquimarina algicola]
MDRNSIKHTGILEQYLLGELSKDQQLEIEKILIEDNELREYYNDIERNFEKIAFENAITPPDTVKTRLLNKIDRTDKQVIPIQKSNTSSVLLAVAASISIFFMISSGWLYTQWQDSKNSMTIIEKETQNLNERIVTLEKNLNETNKWYNAINNPNTVKLILKGNQISPSSRAITYVNHEEKTVILNPKSLTKIDDDQTYQMWADVDGEMINMGIISSDNKMIAMKYIDNATSINITIEPKGGSDHPTVEKLIANVLL